jgi:membrane protein YdbS with pleckstrin-like domain
MIERRIKPDPNYYTAQRYILTVVSLVLVLMASIAHFIIYLTVARQEPLIIIWSFAFVIIFILWIVIYPLIRLWINNLEYIIFDDRITIHKGILTKTEQNIPHRSVTDFILKRGPFDRMLGIGTISIQTAGQSAPASTYEGNLAGILNYASLHQDLKERMRSIHSQDEFTKQTESVESTDNQVLSQILEEIKDLHNDLKD